MTTVTTPSNRAMPTTRGMNFFEADPNLERALRVYAGPEDAERALPHLREVGRCAGDELDELAAQADANPPVLRTHDRFGQRVDEIVYHPAFVEMQRLGFSRFGFAAMSHREGVLGWPGRVPHVVKFALSYVFVQAEFGLFCPISMTDSAARVLRMFGSPELQGRYVPRLTSTDFGELMQSAQLLTERTGGSDVGASECVARLVDGEWRIWGEKWFCSNAGADVHLALARPEGAPAGTKGLGMFLVPKLLPDGSRNRYVIRRLKEKLGSRSMPTGEYEFEGATGYVVGEIDRGFAQMAEMINVSRLSNGMRAAALMRRSLLEAAVHARGRAAFGRALFDLPLVREQLFEMVLDSEAALAIVLFAAQALDRADAGSEHDELVVRITTPLIKYANCRRARWTTGMAMNIRGGNGYIEEWVNARLLRDAHLGSIWEGAENVVALDVARAAIRNGAHEALFRELETRLDGVTDELARREAAAVREEVGRVRRQFERLLQASEDEREAKMAAMCDRLAAAVCASLLTVEGDREAASGHGYGKLVAAREYRRRYLERQDPLEADTGALRWVGALIDGAPVPAAALG
ncbi:acyl-CoA dehydrogenase family protein [Tepidiforma sp.]|uniref:acyl-CoA dehydrogenase family protein n=1 Tax=Tepidiforma sp. TaxID=2682230 RepID=UPI0025835100|nr:acyl-CoA dehydrogenase family protein [Tepidiforma sp.]